MAEGFLCKENDVPCKKRLRHPPLRSNVPGIFSTIFFVVCQCSFQIETLGKYTQHYIEQFVISQINHNPFLLRSFNSEQNFFSPVAPTFPNFPVFISSFALRFFEVFELTFVPVGLCNLFYIIRYPIISLVPVQSLTVFVSIFSSQRPRTSPLRKKIKKGLKLKRTFSLLETSLFTNIVFVIQIYKRVKQMNILLQEYCASG